MPFSRIAENRIREALEQGQFGKWVELAETHASDERQMKYSALRDALLMKMTTAQVAEGHQRVQEWTGMFEK